MRRDRFQSFSVSLIWISMCLFAVVPLCCLLLTSLLPDPMHSPTTLQFTFDHYQTVFTPLYRRLIFKSLSLGFITTCVCLIIAYPYALCLSRLRPSLRKFILLLTIIPLWTSSLLRTYAIITILKTHGLLNKLLLKLHLIKTPLLILFSKTAVLIGLVYNLLPFMILPLFHNIERLDPKLLDAAYDLGASKWQTFIKVILPLTRSGIISGCTVVFLPAITLFYIPDLLGGAKSMLIGNLIQYEFLTAQNWPLGAAIGMSILLSITLTAYLLKHVKRYDD